MSHARKGSAKRAHLFLDCRCLRGSQTDSNRTVRLEILGVPSGARRAGLHQHGGDFWRGLGFLPLVAGRLCGRQIESVRSRTHGEHVAPAGSGQFSPGGRRASLQTSPLRFLRRLRAVWSPALLAKDSGRRSCHLGGVRAAALDPPAGHLRKTCRVVHQVDREISGQGSVNISAYEEGLGRVMYVAGALEHERPFLAPLYKFMVMHRRGSVRKVPPYVSFFLRYLSRQVRQSRHDPCAEELRPAAQAPRVDAQASDERTGIGGWLPFVRDDGTLDKWQSRWFSAEIRKEDWPWIFEKDGRPALVISTLEALAVLVGLKLFYGSEPQPHQTQVQVVPTWTDNRGNGSVLNKLMTTRFPSSAVVMELAAFMKKRRLKATVQWAPRETNREAERAFQVFKTSGYDPCRGTRRAKRRPEERLCVTDPW